MRIPGPQDVWLEVLIQPRVKHVLKSKHKRCFHWVYLPGTTLCGVSKAPAMKGGLIWLSGMKKKKEMSLFQSSGRVVCE